MRARAREAPARTGRAEERAGVRARDREDGRHHAVLDERARDDERHRHPGAVAALSSSSCFVGGGVQASATGP